MIGSSSDVDALSIDTNGIREWPAIVTLIVFVLTNINVIWPWKLPIPVPLSWYNSGRDLLSRLRIKEPRRESPVASSPPRLQLEGSELEKCVPRRSESPSGSVSGPGAGARTGGGGGGGDGCDTVDNDKPKEKTLSKFKIVKFPMNFVTAPIIADLFLLAIGAIGGKEVRQGTLGANNISPLDIMLFFITLAYIAISIDASGLIRFLAFKVLEKGRGNGRRLFLYLYAFFFSLTTCIGNDPVILSGTAFLAYMTRAAKDMEPRAWIFSQFAAANIGSAILVSSNPTNLVLAGAFQIKFIHYTANMVIPTLITAIVLFPFLLYFVFKDEKQIPPVIDIHELPLSLRSLKPMNPNMPRSKTKAPSSSEGNQADDEGEDLLMREEVLNPFLDTISAIVGSVVMAVTLAAVLGLNAASTTTGEHPVFYVTLPAAFLMFCWDVGFGWVTRKTTQKTAEEGAEKRRQALAPPPQEKDPTPALMVEPGSPEATDRESDAGGRNSSPQTSSSTAITSEPEKINRSTEPEISSQERKSSLQISPTSLSPIEPEKFSPRSSELLIEENSPLKHRTTLEGSWRRLIQYLRKTFPTTMAVFSHLPLALVPFAFAMFILVQALVSKNWVATFAYGWKHWVDRTGVVGAIGGMGFLSVILCNFAGTNIGTTILLSRVIQTWEEIHRLSGSTIDDRTFWATVYSMALGVNFGAFSSALSASLAGLLWHNILERKKIHVSSLEFVRVNLPIISVAMVVGLAALIVQIYITKDGTVH